jgi:hypothetical protein
MKQTVTGNTTNSLFNVQKGQSATVFKRYWCNGEGWFKLRLEDGTEVDSPDVFWI